MNGQTALIDGDVLVYKAGFSSEDRLYQIKEKDGSVLGEFAYKAEVDEFISAFLDEGEEYEIVKTSDPQPIEAALSNTKRLLTTIIENTGAAERKIYLTGEGNFREDLATILPYKGNRTAGKPYHYDNIRDYLIKYWDAEVIPYQEADDAMGIEQYQDFLKGWKSNLTPEGEGLAPEELGTIICTIDKDLDMIPGWHYNLDNHSIYWINEKEGIRKFYEQLVVGDRVDNIQGVPGGGPAKARKILHDCESECDMYRAVFRAYLDSLQSNNGGSGDEQVDELSAFWMLWENANLLWIRRDQQQYWEPPCEYKEGQQQDKSTNGIRVHGPLEASILEPMLAGTEIQDFSV